METELNNLEQVKTHHADPVWIRDHAGEIYDLLAKAIKRESQPGEAVESLLLVYPFAVTNGEVKRWSKLLQDALATRNHFDLEKASEYSNSPIQQQFMLSEAKEEIEEEFKAAMRRARKRLKPSLILEAYIDLFKSQIYHRKNDFTPELVRSAIKLARQVNLPESYGSLHLALAFAYTAAGDYDRGIEYGRLAYNYWVTTSEKKDIVNSAYIVSVAYRHKNTELDWQDAADWLARAEEHISKSADPTSYISVTGERGNLYIMLRDYPNAVKWLRRALKVAEKHDDGMRAAIANQSLGIALTEDRKYDEGREHLQNALAYWESQDSPPYIGHVNYSLGRLERRAGNVEEGRTLLLRGKDILESLPDVNDYYQHIINNIDKELAEIH